jgi:radical SAM protein with 4Fe4S-binding SPASM domain
MSKAYQQDPPFAVQVEIIEGCQLRCSFCGLNGIRGKDNDFKIMDAKHAAQVASMIVEAGWNARIEFAMHGEPTMHPQYVEVLGAFREAAPSLQMMVTSNGGGLLRPPGPMERVLELFRAGVNILALDEYEGVSIVSKVREAFVGHKHPVPGTTHWVHPASGALSRPIDIYEYPANKDASPHSRRPKNSRTLVLMEDISKATKGTHSLLNNHAGAAAPLNDSMAGARCAKPFREMAIRWDGNVAVCCNDWRGTYKAGNVFKDGLVPVWNSAAMDAARKKLYHGERDFGPCKGCDAASYRVGLLPDKFGKVKLPKAGPKDRDIINRALAGKPYAAPVLRPWEQK